MSPRAHLYSSPSSMSSVYHARIRLSACAVVLKLFMEVLRRTEK